MDVLLGTFGALFLTLAIEIPVVMAFSKRYDPYFILEIAIINIITNVSLSMIIYYSDFGKVGTNVFYLELAIFLIEGTVYSFLKPKKPVMAFASSLIANAVSYLIGILISGISKPMNMLLYFLIPLAVFLIEAGLYVFFHFRHSCKREQ